MTREIWKDIRDYEGYYQVSNLGRIKSLPRLVNCSNDPVSKRSRSVKERILKESKIDWYKDVSLSKNYKSKSFKIHRLVALAFLDNPEKYKEVNHKNGIRSDNRVINLEWCSRSQNALHAHRNGLIKQKNKYRGICLVNRPNGRKVWQASVLIDGKDNYIGHYKTEEEAHFGQMVFIRSGLKKRLLSKLLKRLKRDAQNSIYKTQDLINLLPLLQEEAKQYEKL